MERTKRTIVITRVCFIILILLGFLIAKTPQQTLVAGISTCLLLYSMVNSERKNKTTKHAVCALIYDKDNPQKVWAVSRKDDHTKFGLPGGKVDEGETAEQAIVREVREEIGRDFTITKKVYQGIDDNGYFTETFEGTITDQQHPINEKETGLVKKVYWTDLIYNSPYKKYNKEVLFKVIDNKLANK